MVRFKVRELFRLPSRLEFVVTGVVLEGWAQAGHVIHFEVQDRLFVTAAVSSVEFLDRISVGESLTCLVCKESDPHDTAFYSDLCPPGTIVELTEVAPPTNKSGITLPPHKS